MRVALDLTALLPQPTGVDRYLTGIVRALARVDSETDYRVYVNREDRHMLQGLPENFSIRAACVRARAVRLGFQQAMLPALAEAGGADVIHSPSFIQPLAPTRARHLLTVHDMTSFSHTGMHDRLRSSSSYRWAVRWSARRADRIAVPSQFVADDVHRWIPGLPSNRVVVARPGIDSRFRPRPAGEVQPVLERLGIRTPYVLFVGTIEPRKNLSTLLDAFLGLTGIEERLVIAGRVGWKSEGTLARLREGARQGRVQRIGYVSDEDLPALYAGARLFVFPSFAEGFGFPPLEAMASGVPVVAADNSAIAENLRGAAELVPARDCNMFAGAIARALRDEGLRRALRSAGLARVALFGWDQMGREIVSTYHGLTSASPPRLAGAST